MGTVPAPAKDPLFTGIDSFNNTQRQFTSEQAAAREALASKVAEALATVPTLGDTFNNDQFLVAARSAVQALENVYQTPVAPAFVG